MGKETINQVEMNSFERGSKQSKNTHITNTVYALDDIEKE